MRKLILKGKLIVEVRGLSDKMKNSFRINSSTKMEVLVPVDQKA